MSRVNHLSSLSLLAVLVLAGCSSQAPQPLKKGEKAIDVASVVRQKMPASVKDRDAWAKDLATTFESQGLAPTLENVCSVLAVAQQESNYQADPAVPGLSKIAWQEIDRRAERMHIPAFLVHTALKIKSPNGKSYSERLDSVRTEKQLSAIFDDLISMVPMGQTCLVRLILCAPVGRCRSALLLPNSIPKGIRGKWTVQFVRKSSVAAAGCGLVLTIY